MNIPSVILKFLLKLFDGFESLSVQIMLGRVMGIPIPFEKAPKYKILIPLFYIYCGITFAFFAMMYTGLEISKAVMNIGSLEKTTQNFALSITHISGILKIINLVYRRDKFQSTLKLLKQMTERFVNTDSKKTVLRNTERITKFVFFEFATLVSATALLCATTLFAHPEDSMENFPYHAHFPSFVPLLMKLLTMSIATEWDAMLIVIHDCIIMSLMNHICAQLLVLEQSLKELTVDNYGTPPMVQLKLCVIHHQLIINLRNEIENIFSNMMLLQFLTSLFIFGLTGFQATVGSYNAYQFNVYAYCCCIFSELFIYCWFAHQVINQSDSLGYDAYSSSWHVFGRDYSKILQMIIAKSLKPIQLTGGGFFIISLSTFSSILSRSYSYIALLRQMYYGEKI